LNGWDANSWDVTSWDNAQSTQVSVLIGVISATTDGADTSAVTISLDVLISSATTDEADVSVAAVSAIAATSSATTDGADVSAATVDPQESVIGVSSATTDGADISAATIQTTEIIFGGHSGKKPKEANWEQEKQKKQERLKVLAALFEDLPPDVQPIAAKAITGVAAPKISWEPIIADLDRFQAAIMQMAIAKAARQDEEDIEELFEMGVL